MDDFSQRHQELMRDIAARWATVPAQTVQSPKQVPKSSPPAATTVVMLPDTYLEAIPCKDLPSKSLAQYLYGYWEEVRPQDGSMELSDEMLFQAIQAALGDDPLSTEPPNKIAACLYRQRPCCQSQHGLKVDESSFLI